MKAHRPSVTLRSKRCAFYVLRSVKAALLSSALLQDASAQVCAEEAQAATNEKDLRDWKRGGAEARRAARIMRLLAKNLTQEPQQRTEGMKTSMNITRRAATRRDNR